MKRCEAHHTTKRSFLRYCSVLLCICIGRLTIVAQDCPPNIDFETGTFDGWTCYIGSTAEVSGQNVISLGVSGPVYGRHTMFSASQGAIVDPYGGFPVLCPNGSGHSIRLGNDLAGTQAEGISYQFTIPTGKDIYSLIYHYAVVFQDPNHESYQQPRMEIEITNVTDNETIQCSSFTFIPYGTILPGFFESPNPPDNTPVWCKDWSAVSINLDGMAGKTIRLFFKTADCTFKRHFGYAYIDVNSECSSEFVGANYCPDDTTVNVTAPYGYQTYTWYNTAFTQVLGSTQTINFTPPPPVGTKVAVVLVPYDGYGCLDTLYAQLIDTLSIKSNAGNDITSCNKTPVLLGSNGKPGFFYNWTPATGLDDPNIPRPLASPNITTTYTLTIRHDGGGCVNSDDVKVKASAIDNSLQLIGKDVYCDNSGDSSILRVLPTDSIEWYIGNAPITGAHKINYRVIKSGTYHAMLYNNDGCTLATEDRIIFIDKAKPGIRYPLLYAIIDLPLGLQARQFGSSALWKPSIHLDDPATYTPVFKSATEQFYTIEIRTTTGCLTVDSQMVKTVPYAGIYVPTAFTPNNDGLNDNLYPTLIGIKELRYFKVFNRWGQLVYQSTKELPGWNGNMNGQIQTTGVFVWMVEGVGVDDKVITKKGTTVLIR